MDYPTPRVAELLFRLSIQSAELQANMERLQRRLGIDPELLVLNPAPENIVDRKKEKQRHRKRWTIVLKEIVDSAIEYESLPSIHTVWLSNPCAAPERGTTKKIRSVSEFFETYLSSCVYKRWYLKGHSSFPHVTTWIENWIAITPTVGIVSQYVSE